jgi:large subunit ribosomal protein L1
MGSKKTVDMAAETQPKVVETKEKTKEETKEKIKEKAKAEIKAETIPASANQIKTEQKLVKTKKVRGKKYQAVRSKLDKSRFYTIKEAVELVKKLSYTKFVGSIEAHIVVKEIGDSVSLALPHFSGKTVKVTIVNAQVLSDIEAGKLDFDVLVAHPEFMPKLAKFASVLGPKGLMPNPKNGTLTPNPELKKQELEAGKFVLKTEKKAPLMHLVIGKTDMSSADLLDNINALIKALKGKILKLVISPSMGPGVKVLIEEGEKTKVS